MELRFWEPNLRPLQEQYGVITTEPPLQSLNDKFLTTTVCCGRFFVLPMELDLGSEGGVHIQLARVDHDIFCCTQRKLEGHTGGIREDNGDARVFGLRKVAKRSGDHFSVTPGFSGLVPNI